jgi:hypothetical protein
MFAPYPGNYRQDISIQFLPYSFLNKNLINLIVLFLIVAKFPIITIKSKLNKHNASLFVKQLDKQVQFFITSKRNEQEILVNLMFVTSIPNPVRHGSLAALSCILCHVTLYALYAGPVTLTLTLTLRQNRLCYIPQSY